jgi:hypothetical protein
MMLPYSSQQRQMLKTMHALKTDRELERLEQAGSSFLPSEVGTSELTVAHERCAELFLAGSLASGPIFSMVRFASQNRH